MCVSVSVFVSVCVSVSVCGCVCVCVCVCVGVSVCVCVILIARHSMCGWAMAVCMHTVLLTTPFHSRARSTALKRLASLLATKDGHIESLSLSNSKLKENTVTVLESLLKNNTLLKLDIRYVCVYMCVCMCVCVWGGCECACVCACVYVCVWGVVSVHVCVHVCMCVWGL